MSQKETQADKAKESTTNLILPEIAAMGKKRLEEFATIQTEQLDKLQEMNRSWFERVQSEATLASEFAAKLTAARSIPEVATAYQEWATQHMEMAAEDAKRIFADGQKLAETGARLLSSGWQPNGRGLST
jgi:cell division septum initiation protein DivIVA